MALLPDFGSESGINFKVGIVVAEQAVRDGTAGASCGDGVVQQNNTCLA